MKYRNFTNKLMLMVGVTATAVLTSCEQEFYQDEQYRKEIYIVSGEDNIFQREFAFGGEEIGYLSVYASGTTPIEKEVMVELERNETVLSDYNQKRYGDNYKNYVLELPDTHYKVDDWSIKLYPNAKYIKKSIFYNVDTLENKVHFKDPAEKDVNECYAPLKYDAALKLNKAYQSVKNDGYNIKIYDSYRPYSVTKSIYNKFKTVAEANDKRGKDMRNAMNKDGLNIDWFLAANKSAHNYGIALDLTLTKNGEEIKAQTKMHQLDASAAISNNNDETNKLQEYMTSAGFITLKSEWWHFQDGRTKDQYVSGNYCDFQVE